MESRPAQVLAISLKVHNLDVADLGLQSGPLHGVRRGRRCGVGC